MSARKELAKYCTPKRAGAPSGLRAGPWARGFTLIELMVVVVIIMVMAGIAAPTAVAQLRDRRVQESARKIATMFREARLQAVGRGSAVLMRYDGTSFTLLEAREGPLSVCPNAPVANCLGVPWVSNPGMSRVLSSFAPGAPAGDLATQTVTLQDAGGSTVGALEVCFSPNGRAFSRQTINDGTALTPMSQVYLATLTRPGKGRPRRVALLPNGTARMTPE